MSKSNPTAERVGHRRCTFILPALNHRHHLPVKVPRWMRERTHGCWCSAWRLTERGWRVWRKGRWAKPKRGELMRLPALEVIPRARKKR